MRKFPKSGVESVLPIAFNREKYGRELLVDAAFIADMPGFNRTERPHRLDFFDIVLVTSGSGTFALEERIYPVKPGAVFFSRPGDVRQWKVPSLDGAVLFFAPEFFTDVFRDTRFLEQFACFHPERPSSAMELNASERRTFLRRFRAMRSELAAARPDEPHVLRAFTYELLVLLNRAYVRTHGAQADEPREELIERFRDLIEARYTTDHGVEPYARRLGVTPRYLNDHCRTAGMASAGEQIHARISLEARRLLLYTELPVAHIGEKLGFDDPAYFARFFRRVAGLSPTAFRTSKRARRTPIRP